MKLHKLKLTFELETACIGFTVMPNRALLGLNLLRNSTNELRAYLRKNTSTWKRRIFKAAIETCLEAIAEYSKHLARGRRNVRSFDSQSNNEKSNWIGDLIQNNAVFLENKLEKLEYEKKENKTIFMARYRMGLAFETIAAQIKPSYATVNRRCNRCELMLLDRTVKLMAARHNLDIEGVEKMENFLIENKDNFGGWLQIRYRQLLSSQLTVYFYQQVDGSGQQIQGNRLNYLIVHLLRSSFEYVSQSWGVTPRTSGEIKRFHRWIIADILPAIINEINLKK